jgi:hypothetical protein
MHVDQGSGLCMDPVYHKHLGLKLALDLPDMKKFQLDPTHFSILNLLCLIVLLKQISCLCPVDIGPKLEFFLEFDSNACVTQL